MTSEKLAKKIRRERALSEYNRLASMESASVELIINSDNLTPEEITQRIGIEPSEAFKKGDFIVETEKHRHHHTSHICTYYTDNHCSSKQVEDHLKWLLENLLYDKRQAIKELQDDGAMITINADTKAFVSTNYVRLDPDIFQKLASLKIGVQFKTKFTNTSTRF